MEKTASKIKTTSKMKMTSKVKTASNNEDNLKTEDNLKNKDDLEIVKDHTALPYTAVAVISQKEIEYADIDRRKKIFGWVWLIVYRVRHATSVLIDLSVSFSASHFLIRVSTVSFPISMFQ